MVESDKAEFLDSNAFAEMVRGFSIFRHVGKEATGGKLAVGVAEGCQYLCLSSVWTDKPWILQKTKLFKNENLQISCVDLF